MSPVKVHGIPFTFADGVERIIPPIALGDLEQLEERLKAYRGELDKASIGTLIDVTHAALKRNYPELQRTDVTAMLDVGNMLDVFNAVMDVGGLRRKSLNAAPEKPAGEAMAPLTGASSTAT